MKAISSVVQDLPPSGTVALADKARAMKAQGLKVTSFAAGEPDFDTPQHIKEAAYKSLASGFTHYTSSSGIPKLLEAIAAKLQRDSGITVDPGKEIIVTTGSKIAIYIALAALLNPGDEVLIFEPAWVSYEAMVRLAGGVPVPVRLDWRTNFRLEEQQAEALVTLRTKAMLVNSPNNPTGRVLSAEELQVIEKLAVKHDLYIISDEVYDRIVYNVKPVSPGSLPSLRQRTLTVNGFSKTYAMTGWRLGYVAGNRDIMNQILSVQQHLVTCAVSFIQEAGIAALNGPQEPMEAMLREYRQRREAIVCLLNQMPGVSCPMPEGAFYALPRFEAYRSSEQLAATLLEKCLIAVTPGAAFGHAGESHLRFSYACSMQDIETGMRLLREFLRP